MPQAPQALSSPRGGWRFSGCWAPVAGRMPPKSQATTGWHPSGSSGALQFPPQLVTHGLLPGSASHLVKPLPVRQASPHPACLLALAAGGQPTLSALSCPAGARGIVNSGLIPPLVWKLQGEEEEIQELLLDTLVACLTEDATEALSSRVVPFLKEKLLSTNHDIRSKATRVLTAVRWGCCGPRGTAQGGPSGWPWGFC